MNSIRKIIRRLGNTITIEHPDEFQAETAEVIIEPVEDLQKEILPIAIDGLTELQRLLLKAPLVTDEEIHSVEEKRKALNQWQEKCD